MSPPPPDPNDTPTEQTTLLPQDVPSFQDQNPSSSSQLYPTLLTVASLTLLFTMGVQITTAPSLAILQGIICRKYYEEGITDSLSLGKGLGLRGVPTNFEDNRCKVGPVQSEVAEVNAWKDVFEILPAVALAIPWGILTDRIGRKKVLLLALFGCLLNEAWVRLVYYFPTFFPIRAVWFGGLFQLLGSGSTTFTSIVYVLIADVCPPEQRSTFFSYLLASSIVSRFVFVPIGGAMIAYDDAWLAMWIGMLVQVVGYVVAVVFVEETLPSSSGTGDDEIGSGELMIGAEGEGEGEEEEGEEGDEMVMKNKTVMQRVEEYLEKAKEAGTWILQNPKAVLLLLCFWLYYMGEQVEQLLMIQYASKRLGWSLGKASLLPSLGALTNLLTLTLLLPFLSTFFSHSSPYPWARMGEEAKDALLSRLFATLLTLGCLFISLPISSSSSSSNVSFLASGEVLYSAGAALSVPLRSLITNLVDARHRATLYTVISVVTYAATSAGRPVAAGLFSVGLKLGEGKDQKGNQDGMRWMGLPFLVAGGMFAVCLGVVSLVGFGRRKGEIMEEGGEQEGVEGVGERYRD